MAIDETLYSYRGRIGIKQFNPSKPAKYGLIYRSLCNSTIPCTYFTLPYAGKLNNVGLNNASKFYVSDTDEYTKYLVAETSKYNKLKETKILMDRYFTSVSVGKLALDDQSITIVGTIRHDRKEIPKELKMLDGREEKSTMYVYSEDGLAMLVSYFDKKRVGKKHSATDNDA